MPYHYRTKIGTNAPAIMTTMPIARSWSVVSNVPEIGTALCVALVAPAAPLVPATTNDDDAVWLVPETGSCALATMV